MKKGGYLPKRLDSGKSFYGISVNTNHDMGFEADTPEKWKQDVKLSDFRTKIWVKCYWRATEFSANLTSINGNIKDSITRNDLFSMVLWTRYTV